MSKRNNKKSRYWTKTYKPPASEFPKTLFRISSNDIELSPEDERIIREVELRYMREQGHLP